MIDGRFINKKKMNNKKRCRNLTQKVQRNYQFKKDLDALAAKNDVGAIWRLSGVKYINRFFTRATSGFLIVVFCFVALTLIIALVYSAVLEAEPLNAIVRDNDISTTLQSPNFLVALILRDVMVNAAKKAKKPFERLYNYLQTIGKMNLTVESILESQIKSLHKKLTASDKLYSRDTVDLWLDGMRSITKEMYIIVQTLHLYSIRLFKDRDSDSRFLEYGLNMKKIDQYIHDLRTKFDVYDLETPVVISDLLVTRMGKLMANISAEPLPGMPTISVSLNNSLSDELSSLKNELISIKIDSQVRAPQIINMTNLFILIIFWVVVQPIDNYSAVGPVSILLGPIISTIYFLVFLVSIFIANGFSSHPNWDVPDYDDWRNSMYRDTYNTKNNIMELIDRTEYVIDKYTRVFTRELTIPVSEYAKGMYAMIPPQNMEKMRLETAQKMYDQSRDFEFSAHQQKISQDNNLSEPTKYKTYKQSIRVILFPSDKTYKDFN